LHEANPGNLLAFAEQQQAQYIRAAIPEAKPCVDCGSSEANVRLEKGAAGMAMPNSQSEAG